MGKVRLMNRIDTKFVCSVEKVAALLLIMSENYMIQEIDGKCNMPYFTCYYDTADVDMYYQHQRGKKTRQKVRTRLYEGSMDLPFLEIKRKNNKGRTKKKRILMEEGEDFQLYSDFLEKHNDYPISLLEPQIENHFNRITLVNNSQTERITIDTDLTFRNVQNRVEVDLSSLGIIEWKKDGRANNSYLEKLLRELQIHESGFSKYCIGMAITNPMLKQNRLKPKLRLIDRIMNKEFVQCNGNK